MSEVIQADRDRAADLLLRCAACDEDSIAEVMVQAFAAHRLASQPPVAVGMVERLRELLAKATPLPWVPNYAQPGAYGRIETDAHGYFNDGWVVASELLGPDAENNIALIVEAVNALPALLAALQPHVDCEGGVKSTG